tara:strand:- start:1211 stop:1975 length:765 start_codon:yes stop_codon:yes gene_type:complete
MWRWLHPYAKPEATYRLVDKLLPWFAGLTVVSLLVGMVWGLAFAPSDYQQGDSYRIIYIHVPAAIFSMGAYFGMAICGAIALIWQIKTAEWALPAIAPVGAAMTAIALFTGAIWGKPMWGTWWVWDARLTSELILLFLYVGVMALYAAFDDARAGAKAASILAIVGVVNLPIIHYSVEWWNTLHQGATITKLERPSIATSMLWPLLISLLGFMLLTATLVLMRYKNQLLKHELNRPWAQAELAQDSSAVVEEER